MVIAEVTRPTCRQNVIVTGSTCQSQSHTCQRIEKCSFSLEAMVRGYHMYRSVWEAAIGEELMCVQEVGNRTDPYAVAVVKPHSGELTVGHLP